MAAAKAPAARTRRKPLDFIWSEPFLLTLGHMAPLAYRLDVSIAPPCFNFARLWMSYETALRQAAAMAIGQSAMAASV